MDKKWAGIYTETLNVWTDKELNEMAWEYYEDLINPEDTRAHKVQFSRDCYSLVLAEINRRAA